MSLTICSISTRNYLWNTLKTREVNRSNKWEKSLTEKGMINYNQNLKEGKIVCDNCGEEEFFCAIAVNEFIERVKLVGWEIKEVGKGFKHYCFYCKE